MATAIVTCASVEMAPIDIAAVEKRRMMSSSFSTLSSGTDLPGTNSKSPRIVRSIFV